MPGTKHTRIKHPNFIRTYSFRIKLRLCMMKHAKSTSKICSNFCDNHLRTCSQIHRLIMLSSLFYCYPKHIVVYHSYHRFCVSYICTRQLGQLCLAVLACVFPLTTSKSKPLASTMCSTCCKLSSREYS